MFNTEDEALLKYQIENVAKHWGYEPLEVDTVGCEDSDGRRLLVSFGLRHGFQRFRLSVLDDGSLAQVAFHHTKTGGKIWNGDDVVREEYRKSCEVERVIAHSSLVQEMAAAEFRPSSRQLEAIAVDVLNLGLGDVLERYTHARDASAPAIDLDQASAAGVEPK